MDKTDWVQAIWVMKTPSGKGWESSSIICNWKMFQSASEIDYDVHKLLKLMIWWFFDDIDDTDDDIPSGKRLHNYGKSTFIVDFHMNNGGSFHFVM